MKQEVVYSYDGSWVGFLCTIFESFERKEIPILVVEQGRETPHLFSLSREIFSDEKKAQRVLRGLRKQSLKIYTRIYKAYLSEKKDREVLSIQLARLVFKNVKKAEFDYGNPFVLRAKQIEKELGREVHRMHAFVRFQHGVDEIWYAFIKPDFNVLPLIGEHFEKRYADQKWVIYDLKREYGIFYDLEKTDFIELDFKEQIKKGSLPSEAVHLNEKAYQQLWKGYFKSATIQERKNMKLHIRHVPRRYWDLMTEKRE